MVISLIWPFKLSKSQLGQTTKTIRLRQGFDVTRPPSLRYGAPGRFDMWAPEWSVLSFLADSNGAQVRSRPPHPTPLPQGGEGIKFVGR